MKAEHEKVIDVENRLEQSLADSEKLSEVRQSELETLTVQHNTTLVSLNTEHAQHLTTTMRWSN